MITMEVSSYYTPSMTARDKKYKTIIIVIAERIKGLYAAEYKYIIIRCYIHMVRKKVEYEKAITLQ